VGITNALDVEQEFAHGVQYNFVHGIIQICTVINVIMKQWSTNMGKIIGSLN